MKLLHPNALSGLEAGRRSGRASAKQSTLVLDEKVGSSLPSGKPPSLFGPFKTSTSVLTAHYRRDTRSVDRWNEEVRCEPTGMMCKARISPYPGLSSEPDIAKTRSAPIM